MEIGKVEKFDLNTLRISRSSRDEFYTKALNLSPGEGFIVNGMERSPASTRLAVIAKDCGDGRKFSTHTLGLGKFRVVRVK